MMPLDAGPAVSRQRALEHVPKKLRDFFDKDMLQLFEIERFLFDHVIPRVGKRSSVESLK